MSHNDVRQSGTDSPFPRLNGDSDIGERDVWCRAALLGLAQVLLHSSEAVMDVAKYHRSGLSIASPLRILLAEDDDSFREYLATTLGFYGHIVTVVPNGFWLIHALRDWLLDDARPAPADALICDVRMPGVDGITIMEGMHDLPRQIPTVLMSGIPRERLKLGPLPDDVVFMQKPLVTQQLDQALRRLVRGR